MDEAVGLDADQRRVLLAQEAPVEYTQLIVATGAVNSYFGHDDWRKVAPGLKSIEDATTMRHKILAAFESAEREPDPAQRRAWLTFVVVGAGPTGVELAGALAEIARTRCGAIFATFVPKNRGFYCWMARRTCCRHIRWIFPSRPRDNSSGLECGRHQR